MLRKLLKAYYQLVAHLLVDVEDEKERGRGNANRMNVSTSLSHHADAMLGSWARLAQTVASAFLLFAALAALALHLWQNPVFAQTALVDISPDVYGNITLFDAITGGIIAVVLAVLIGPPLLLTSAVKKDFRRGEYRAEPDD